TLPVTRSGSLPLPDENGQAAPLAHRPDVCATMEPAPARYQAETAGACEERRELVAARTKLLPSSHIGPGNLRQSAKTLSSPVTKSAISFSPMMSGGRILSTSMACPAT